MGKKTLLVALFWMCVFFFLVKTGFAFTLPFLARLARFARFARFARTLPGSLANPTFIQGLFLREEAVLTVYALEK
jgi:hypothetical protein